MDVIDALQRLGLALAIGVLVGIERGWQNRDLPDGGRVAGIRTYALVGFLGGLSGYLFAVTGPILPAAFFLGFALTFAAFSFKLGLSQNDHSVTGVMAALAVFALGFAAIVSDERVAAAGGVVITALLAARHSLHGFLRSINWIELRSALVLLAMSFVALPLLPNRTIDPWGGFNPFEIWLMTILIAAISYVGYLAVRIVGSARGVLFAGAAGGFVSSTAVTLNFARFSVVQPHLARPLASSACLAGALSLCRAFAIGVVLSPALISQLVIVYVPAVLIFLAGVLWLYRKRATTAGHTDLKLENPFELLTVLRFGALLGAVRFLSTLAVDYLGASSIVAIAFVSGIPDLDAITLSTASMAGHAIPLDIAALAIFTASAANLVTKAVLALSFGDRAYGASLASVTALAIAAGAACYYAAAFLPFS